MYLTGDPIIFRGKSNYEVIEINDDICYEPRYKVAEKGSGRVYGFWVPDEDLEYDYNVLENAS
jgi:hypothetical protein